MTKTAYIHRHTHIHTDRQTRQTGRDIQTCQHTTYRHREIHRQPYRPTCIQTETHRQHTQTETVRHIHTYRDIHTYKYRPRQTYRDRQRQAESDRHIHTDTYRDRHTETDRYIQRHTYRNTDRDRHADT